MEWVAGIIAAIVAFFAAFFAGADSLVYELPRPLMRPQEIVVLFGGDIMLDRSVREYMQENGEDHPFSCIRDTLLEADLVVANLEGPITERESLSFGSTVGDPHNTRFTFATTTGQLLARHIIGVVSLGNNHMNDFGAEGVRSTMRYLDAAGVGHFGDPIEHGVAYKVLGDIRLAFIAYNQFDPGHDPAWGGAASTTEQVRHARAAGYVPIVFAHWGDEYVPETAEQRRLAREFIDAGAEVVVGAHPHVVQGGESHAGAYVHYSLGNFVFDQYWEPAVREGRLLKVIFGAGGHRTVEEIPIELRRDRTTCLLQSASSSLQVGEVSY